MSDLQSVFRRGGLGTLRLFEYCVCSVQLDPIFVYCAIEYRRRPSAKVATTLYELFFDAQSPCCLTVPAARPPINLRIRADVDRIRRVDEETLARPLDDHVDPLDPESHFVPPRSLPPLTLFDRVVPMIEAGEQFKNAEQQFDPSREPIENLPNGRMTEGQLRFRTGAWAQYIQPKLVEAGFSAFRCTC